MPINSVPSASATSASSLTMHVDKKDHSLKVRTVKHTQRPAINLPQIELKAKEPIVRNFHKGDLMYGASHARDETYLKKVETFHRNNVADLSHNASNEWARRAQGRNYRSMIINSYNDPVRSTLSDSFQSVKAGGSRRKKAIEDAIKFAMIGRSSQHGFDFQTYKNIAISHPKLKITQKHQVEWDWWKRGSKSGIEMVAQQPIESNVKLHFICDGLDMKGVTTKDPERYGNGITASELRYIYRHWDRLDGKVIFYENNKVINPPWQNEMTEVGQFWKEYSIERHDKKRR